MCCGHGGYHMHDYGYRCGCRFTGQGIHRHFLSREERIGRLKNYLADLKAEMQGVEEEIKLLSQQESE